MPVQTRPSDTFTRDNLLLGFSVVEFTPTGSSTAVPLGILSGESLQKEIDTLALERGDAGTLTVDREIISRLAVSMNLELFNFRIDVAKYIFGGGTITPVLADAAAVGSTTVSMPATSEFDTFLDLTHGNITESSVEVTFSPIISELVGTGDGATLVFQMNQKVKASGDITAITVGGTDRLADIVAGVPATTEIGVTIGENDTTGGNLTFFAGEFPANGAAIVVSYTPSFSTTGTDIVNLTDFVFDPTFGKIRFLDPAGADNSPFRASAGVASMAVAYTYVQNAANSFQPFTTTSFDGSVTIRHLPDIGVNFVWTIPSATIRLTDDDLTFGADDFATATLQMNINDSGGSSRFGTMELSSETESA